MGPSNRFAVLFALAVSGGAAWASCTDTLYLQSFQHYQKTYRVKKTTGVVDSTADTVTVSASSGVLNPSLLLPVSVPSGYAKDSALTPLAFAANCGDDSLSQVRFWRSVDSSSTNALGVAVRVTSGSQVARQMAVRSTGSASYLSGLGDTLKFLSFFSISPKGGSISHYIGVLNTSVGAVGGLSGARATLYKSTGTAVQSYATTGSLPSTGLTYSVNYEAEGLLSATKDSVLKGRYDSLLLIVNGFSTVYNTTALAYTTTPASGIATATAGRSVVGLQRLANGWRLTTATAATGFVRDSQGRLLRSFPVGTSFDWDMTQNGRAASHGIYLVGFEGQGARILALP